MLDAEAQLPPEGRAAGEDAHGLAFLAEWLAAHPDVARPLEMIVREIEGSPEQTARFAALLEGLDDLMHDQYA